MPTTLTRSAMNKVQGEIEHLIRSTPVSMNGAPFAITTPESIAAATELDVETTKGAMARLEASGQWDRIYGRGGESWYSGDILREQRFKPSERDAWLGREALNQAEAYSVTGFHADFGDPSNQELVSKAYHLLGLITEVAAEDSLEPVGLGTVRSVASALSNHYLASVGYTTMSFQQIADASGMSIKSVRHAVRVLGEAGLWGILHGNGWDHSRFYPLFVGRAHEAFKSMVTNPLA